MQHNYLPILLGLFITFAANAQPVSLRSDIQIQKLLGARLGAIKIAKEPVSKQLIYITTDGSVYQIVQPKSGAAYDSLLYTYKDHGITYMQGLSFHDSTIFLSGNLNMDSALTTAIMVKGKLQKSGARVWTTIATTDPYPTSPQFYHLLSGMVVSPAGDSMFVCSGARTDHGEVQANAKSPNTREVPFTSILLGIPTSASNILLKNDSAWLATSGYVYARGVRNTFDLAFSTDRHLFGAENSGDRDQSDEVNWMRKGHHYGFPWNMGNTNNPQQYPNYDPSKDLLVNDSCLSAEYKYYYNDPAFPKKPAGVTFTLPVHNLGPDADKFRDSATGKVMDGSDLGIGIYSVTAHRSPLGLVFDTTNSMGADLTGNAFLLSYTQGGDSTGYTTAGDVGPFDDPSEDMLSIKFTYNPATGNYDGTFTKIVTGFNDPVDAEIVGNIIYVVENAYDGSPNIYKLTMPDPPPTVTGVSNSIASKEELKLFPNPSAGTVTIAYPAHIISNVKVTGVDGKTVYETAANSELLNLNLENLKTGIYIVSIVSENEVSIRKLLLE